MENREQQILAEIKDMMASIRSQLELLDAKMLELQQTVDPEGFDADPIELDIDAVETADVEDDLPFDDLPEEAETVVPVVVEVVAETVEETAEEPEAEIVEEQVAEPQVEEAPLQQAEPEEEEDDDLPGIFDIPAVSYPAAQIAPKVKPSVAEVLTDKQAWRTDMPGSPVKDVRSAISLNDRIIFINHLFNEDPLLFQNVITNINSMENLDQAVEYLAKEFPAWDMGSELVYRFMMAVRRRVK